MQGGWGETHPALGTGWDVKEKEERLSDHKVLGIQLLIKHLNFDKSL